MTGRTRTILVGVLLVLVVGPVLLPTNGWIRMGAALTFLVLAAWVAYSWLHDEHERGTREERC